MDIQVDFRSREFLIRNAGSAWYVAIIVILLWSPQTQGQVLSASGASSMVESSGGASPHRTVVAGSNGLVLSSSDGANTVTVHGYAQADDRMFSSNIRGQDLDTFLFRRIRPQIEGTVFNAVDFRFMPDFGQNNPQIQEAYVEWKTFSLAKLRVGKFKEPIGLEALRSDRDLSFTERSLASDLAPLRYMGAQLSGSVFSNSISYAAGYFNGSNDGSNGNFQWQPANEFASRVFILPFAKTKISALRQLGFGLAGSIAHQHGPIAGLKTMGQSTFFKYSSSTLANGPHTRISPQAYYYVGPVGVLSEYVISSQDVVHGVQRATVTNRAWQVQGSVVLTGEKNTYNGVSPRNRFEPSRGLRHLGAFEVAFRYSQLRVGSNAFPAFASPKTAAQSAQERAIGLNWYLNRFVKLTTDFEYTNFTMSSQAISPLHSEIVLLNRVQLAF
jgi:phosphate-selective porin OprO/OprP